MHLHVTRLLGGEHDVDMVEFAIFNASHLGSRWFDLMRARQSQKDGSWEQAYRKFAALPDFWIGEVSWLKASFLGDPERYVPGPVEAIARLLSDEAGETLPVIDDELIDAILAALTQPNTTSYSLTGELPALRAWLERYRGWYLFEVSW